MHDNATFPADVEIQDFPTHKEQQDTNVLAVEHKLCATSTDRKINALQTTCLVSESSPIKDDFDKNRMTGWEHPHTRQPALVDFATVALPPFSPA